MLLSAGYYNDTPYDFTQSSPLNMEERIYIIWVLYKQPEFPCRNIYENVSYPYIYRKFTSFLSDKIWKKFDSMFYVEYFRDIKG